MSWRATAWASEQITGNPASKSVLWKLADNANDQGRCWPSIRTIAAHTELSERTVQIHLLRLEGLAIISIERRFGVRGEPLPSVFQLAMPEAPTVEKAKPAAAKRAQGGGAGDSPPPQAAQEIHQGGATPAPGGESDGAAYKDEPSIKPSNEPPSKARPAARESGEVISVGKAATDRFQEFVDTVAQTWPGGFPKDNLTASSTAWDRETRLHDATLILECSRLHGREKMKLADARSPSQGKLLLTKPSRWLQSGAWKGYVQEHAQQRAREARLVTAMGNVQRGLGAELFQLFRERFNFSDEGLAAMDGVEFVPGNPALFKCQNFGTVAVLEKRLFELQRLLECEVMVRRVPAVKVG